MKYSLAIIGGGPAGYTAALYCSMAGIETVVIEKLSAGGQMAETGIIENYPGFEDGVQGFDLGEKMRIGAEKFGTTTIYDEVLSIDPYQYPKVIKTSKNDILSDSIVIATGAKPKKIGIPKEDDFYGNGVHYCAYCDGNRYKNKTVAVIGGGNSAAEDAIYLSKICEKVYIVHRREEMRALNKYVSLINNTKNIELVLNSRVLEFLHEDKLKGIKIENILNKQKNDLYCDAVFVAIGRTPDTSVLKEIKKDEYGYIKADETGKTNINGVFAAGDVRTKYLRQIVTAVSDGANVSKTVEEYLKGITDL